jgi:hypothetical protein
MTALTRRRYKRTPRPLAHLLRRRLRRHDRAARRLSGRRRPMGMGLRLLSRHRTGPDGVVSTQRNREELAGRPGRFFVQIEPELATNLEIVLS